MLRRLLIITSIALAAVPLAAQAPAGWKVRIDRSQSAEDPDDVPSLKFVTMGKGFHVTSGPAGTFWNPVNTVTGDYIARATFTLMRPSPHVNYYGLVYGGAELAGGLQNYIYFLVGQNGTYVVRHRAGNQVRDVARTAHDAIRRPADDGRSTNTLEVRVSGNTIAHVVNGTVVQTAPRAGLTAKTEGIVGIRVNHLLDVHVEGFEVQKR